MTRFLFAILFLTVTLVWADSAEPSQPEERSQDVVSGKVNTLPEGYYAFAKAHPNAVPPKVRKPPYMLLDAVCPGTTDQNAISTKNNLCGDLNKGFVHRSPILNMNHPGYPFEIIKNKTLQFLSKTLPYLKEEIDSIPKVARFMKPSQFFEHHRRRSKRETQNEANKKSEEIPVQPKNEFEATKASNSSNGSAQGRHHCSGNAICNALESLREEGPLSKTFLSNVVSAVGNMALEHYTQTAMASAGNVSSNKSSSPSKFNTLLALSQLLTSTLNEQKGDSAKPSPANVLEANPQPPVYSPLLSIIDYVQSFQAPKSRRASDGDESVDAEGTIGSRTVTPCQSTEEYVSPTYARNYQGVWKYVVQIPDEGYFTQTVQQTTCVKSKCDLLEGSCRESPRWVSLLVAEIFYPDVYFPVNQPTEPENVFASGVAQSQQATQTNVPSSATGLDAATLAALAAEIAAKQQSPAVKPTDPMTAAASNQHFQVVNSNHAVNKHPYHHPQAVHYRQHQLQMLQQQHAARPQRTQHDLLYGGMLKRTDGAAPARRGRNLDDASDIPEATAEDASARSEDDGKTKQCDGYDKIGCYQVRVYYDWFLVNGSCKCHRSAHSGGGLNSINETIKRIFIGKWKKK